MAKPLACRLYRDGMATMHESNNPQELIKIGKERALMFGLVYVVKDQFGSVLWTSKGAQEVRDDG